jgi:hypothetical protein
MKNQKTNHHFGLIGICFLAFGFLQSSCTSLQQTTAVASDDLYDISTSNTTQRVATVNTVPEEQYQEFQNYQDDRYLRLKVANRNRWSAIDDFGYWNDPRFNTAYYPSYIGWNSWYAGYYGSSWYYPFGAPYYTMGWGGYYPYMNYGMGWGFNDFGYMGFGGFGGYGSMMGFGYGFGYGWNPYYAGYWNPYYSIYGGYGGYYGGGYPLRGNRYQNQRAMQNSAPNLSSYRNNRQYNNVNNSIQSNNGNVRYGGNPDLNSNFGNLMRRVVTNNPNTSQTNSFDRPARYFSNNNVGNSNQYKTNSNNSSNYSTPSYNSNTGGRSGGFNSSGSSTSHGRAGRGGQ